MIAVPERRTMSMLDGAMLCAEHRLHVIPVWRSNDATCACPRGVQCISPGKHPTIDAWQTSASTDLTILRDWFGDERNNAGVVCGASGVCVIDIDPRNGGRETFAKLTAELGPLPATVSQDTGGGGDHYVFRRPDGDLVSKFGREYPGVDILHDARQFLVEPSLHNSGQTYRWKPDRGPDEIAIATLPPAWVARMRRAPTPRPRPQPLLSTDTRIERARKYLSKIPGAVSGAGGHTQTFNAVAAMMFGFDLSTDATLDLLLEYNQRCDPPWSERELKHKIDSVASRCTRERGYLLDANRGPIHTTQQAAHRAPESAPDDGTPWQQRLIVNDKGKARRGYHNVLIFVRHHPDYAGKLSLNTMTGDVWFGGQPTKDTFVHDVRAFIDSRLGFSPSRDDVDAAILTCAQQRPFHPIRHYLRSIDWDGQRRLHLMAPEYLSTDEPLHAELVRRWMISAVARALNPGCKVDTALMLYGKQGFFKSSFFAVLGGAWHSDSPIDISNKDSFQQIHAAWIYEFAELENVVTGRAESRLKAWVASTHDTFRAPYQRSVERRPRSCVIAGTTNHHGFLTDTTGSRRYWIIPVAKPIDREQLASHRDQLWAEAVCAYDAGETWWLDGDDDAEREKANEAFLEEDPWMVPISDWLNGRASDFTTTDVLTGALDIETSRHDRAAQTRVGKVLARLGVDHKRVRRGRTLVWMYQRCSM